MKLAIEEQMSLASSSASSSNDGDDATPVKPSAREEGQEEEEEDDGVVFWGGGKGSMEEEEEDMTIQVPPLQSMLLLGGGGKEEEEEGGGGHKWRLLEARVAELEGENERLKGAAEAAAAREEQVCVCRWSVDPTVDGNVVSVNLSWPIPSRVCVQPWWMVLGPFFPTAANFCTHACMHASTCLSNPTLHVSLQVRHTYAQTPPYIPLHVSLQ